MPWIFNNYQSDWNLKEYKVDEDASLKSVLIGDLNGIFGLPYQFMDSVDARIPGTEVGTKYAEKIIARMPLLFLTPCKQLFMPGMDGGSKEAVLASLLDGESPPPTLAESGKYYTTDFAYDKYYTIVNRMWQQFCYFAGIATQRIRWHGKATYGFSGNSIQMRDIDWMRAGNDAFGDYFNAQNAIVFYLDGLTTIDDSFSNSTMESSLASQINGFSQQAKEIRFLVGENSALGKMVSSMTDITNSAMEGLSQTVGGVAGGMLGELASKGTHTILEGGKIIFPKMWDDSGYSRSYSFTVKLRSPDHDTVSIALNVIAPYLHLLGAVLPIGYEDDPNGYVSPFLVKAYSKGMFNIDMGLITDLSVTRGAECQWNDDGLPTQIDINIGIEDLYSSLFLTPPNFGNEMAIVKNTGMMDFLANLAGLNLAQPEILRQVSMYAYMGYNDIRSIPGRIWNRLDTGIQNLVSGLFKF